MNLPILHNADGSHQYMVELNKWKRGIKNFKCEGPTPIENLSTMIHPVIMLKHRSTVFKLRRKQWVDRKFKTEPKRIVGNFFVLNGKYTAHYGHIMLEWLPTVVYYLHTYPKFKIILQKGSPMIDSLIAAMPSCANRIVVSELGCMLKIHGFVKFIRRVNIKPCRFQMYSNIGDHQLTNMKRKVLYCPRYLPEAGHGKCSNLVHQDDIMNALGNIKDCDVTMFRPYDTETGDYIPISEQKNMFEDVSVVVGPRGSAIHNILWSNRIHIPDVSPLHVVEFVCDNKDVFKTVPESKIMLRNYLRNDILGSWKQYCLSNINCQYHHIIGKLAQGGDVMDVCLSTLDKTINYINDVID